MVAVATVSVLKITSTPTIPPSHTQRLNDFRSILFFLCKGFNQIAKKVRCPRLHVCAKIYRASHRLFPAGRQSCTCDTSHDPLFPKKPRGAATNEGAVILSAAKDLVGGVHLPRSFAMVRMRGALPGHERFQDSQE